MSNVNVILYSIRELGLPNFLSAKLLRIKEWHSVDSSRRTGTREGGGQRRERCRDILVAAATAKRAAHSVHRLYPRVRAGPGSEDHQEYPAGAKPASRGDRFEAARDLRGVGYGLDEDRSGLQHAGHQASTQHHR